MSTIMSYPIERNAVEYGCKCGQRRPLTHLYFCRHCLQLRCPFCISHEVDLLYCANCLENMPSSEARLKKNRCGSCFDCPSCFHTLSTRATSIQPKHTKEESPKASDSKADPKTDPKAPKKMYFLSCFNCRWTSRDVGMPDQPVATGGWPEQISIYAQRISQLQDHYKAIVLQEKQSKLEKERKKFIMSGKYMTLTDKIGLTSAMARARVAGTSSLISTGDGAPIAAPAVAVSNPNDLPSDIFTKEINIKHITNMEQRLIQPEHQPVMVDKLFPSAKQLFIKKSQRCRQCDHNVTKPEYNPGSIKFKIQLFAYYHIPEIRIVSCEPLKAGKSSCLVLKLSNPTGHETIINLQPYVEPSTEVQEETSENVKPESDEMKLKIQEIDNEFAKMNITCTGKLITPNDKLCLPQRDDASEYVEDTHNYNDDTNVVVWRKSNKLSVKMEVVPDETLKVGDDVCACCVLSYTYTNTVASTPRAPSTHTVSLNVYLHLGKIIQE